MKRKTKITDLTTLLFSYNEYLFEEGYADIDILNEFELKDVYDFLDMYNIEIEFKTLEQ